jgi:hypothetical protein
MATWSDLKWAEKRAVEVLTLADTEMNARQRTAVEVHLRALARAAALRELEEIRADLRAAEADCD